MLLALLWLTIGMVAGFILCAILTFGSREESLRQAWHAGYKHAIDNAIQKNREKRENGY